ncbi:heme A synthase [Polycladomyces sp. WAk]|uniref:Heme A synthase n=1 Tax=Polycladomyces zharkentensis TaxID=2807616 RepID=A0ABS2WJV8_9BACL|nr:heme A synthase [Polycladomyces sp. WAk]
MSRGLKWFAWTTAFGLYLILLMGALVTKTGSGKGCGNTWPFCNGEVFPTYATFQTWVEYSHRVVSGLVGLFVVILAVWAWKVFSRDRVVLWLSIASVFFVVLQGLLGAAAVVWGQSDAVLATHFGFSLMSLAACVLLVLYLEQKDKESASPDSNVSSRYKFGVWGITVYTYFVVYTGAYVRHTGSSLGCGENFPGCGGQWLPDLTSSAGIHLLHRSAAYSLWLLVTGLLWVTVRSYRQHRELVRAAWFAWGFVTLQAVTGIASVLSGIQLIIALLHTTVISIFFSVMCYLCMRVGVPWRHEPALREEAVK